MPKSILFAVLVGVVLLVAATSRSDVAPNLPPPPASGDAVPEPITGTAAVSAPGAETPPRDPFSAYDVGSGGVWTYQQLTPAEQAVADQGRDTTGWDQVHNAYASAVAQRAQQAAGDSAAAQLGVENLAGQGVVP